MSLNTPYYSDIINWVEHNPVILNHINYSGSSNYLYSDDTGKEWWEYKSADPYKTEDSYQKYLKTEAGEIRLSTCPFNSRNWHLDGKELKKVAYYKYLDPRLIYYQDDLSIKGIKPEYWDNFVEWMSYTNQENKIPPPDKKLTFTSRCVANRWQHGLQIKEVVPYGLLLTLRDIVRGELIIDNIFNKGLVKLCPRDKFIVSLNKFWVSSEEFEEYEVLNIDSGRRGSLLAITANKIRDFHLKDVLGDTKITYDNI